MTLSSADMTTEDIPKDTHIVLRIGGVDDPIVDHLAQPADYVHADGTVWTWRQRWRLVGGNDVESDWPAKSVCLFVTC